ncbi:sensor domain-containing diguanylate cyclase [Shewanella fidelis]|uniref:diguanylate cyclase n=1 Tax=Shewanella fidelis TaxID=173509 RepID=A0AAW8NSE4_9GAMM|nr:sensor domain-containing diguanylate cyclase [Shewanella fidelis]MDR8525736.1 sensor domain-containing diguanylate cyclase [Shewanella fidelis]MDW4812755.1 sensor domain-containing diguanylate cyclase [Shewanella fidelis]MDW4816503.1 sensor domain-containing diguanylate cyclase [Shewanella fidelis]MDW4820333.1 sensor domain-containing diguanylate cyclase [Shewanella fidelis]MDW4825219.1 sensor domain-containing diguanylate cyclase [Shewanella fidelis]
MGDKVFNDKKRFIWILSLLLLAAFAVTSGISYQVAHDSLSKQIKDNNLPLTSDNIYSEIQQDLLQPIFISSLMAQDTFVRDWAINQEQTPEDLIRYLKEIQEKYHTVTSFFVSESTRNYYHSSGVLKQIEDINPDDAWYFRVRSLPKSEHYEVNIDSDSADPNRTVIYVNYKVFDFNGKFIGVTGVGLAVESVKRLIDLYQQRYNRNVYFTDRQGNITLHSQQYQGELNLQDIPGLEKLATRILTSPSSSFSYQKLGQTIYLNSRLVPEFKWYLVVEQDDARSEKKLLTTFWINIGLSLLVTLGLLIIANLTLGKYQRKLELMASTDKLTGAANRQAFEETFTQSLAQSVVEDSPISVLLMDIDHFKKINDAHGHNVGDLVIQTLSRLLAGQLGPNDLLCRWGGEEFLILLPECNVSQAAELAEKLRSSVAQRELSVNGGQIKVTISTGVAEYRRSEKSEELINRVDIALYHAKEQGRDRVVISY